MAGEEWGGGLWEVVIQHLHPTRQHHLLLVAIPLCHSFVTERMFDDAHLSLPLILIKPHHPFWNPPAIASLLS